MTRSQCNWMSQSCFSAAYQIFAELLFDLDSLLDLLSSNLLQASTPISEMAAVSALPPQLKAGIHENPFPNQVPPRITELLDKLCTTNRFAEPNSVVYLRSQHCGDNSYIHFTCKSMRQVGADNNDQRISCVLRARKSLNSLDKQQYPIDRQVRMLAALYYQYKNMSSDFPIPELLGCDSGFDNTIGCPFLVYKEVEGTMFLAQYKMVKKSLKLERAQNLLDRRQLVCQMAEFIAKKEQLVLNGYGFIINESDIPTDNPRALTNSDNLGVISAKIAGSHISSSPSFGVFVGKLAYAWQRSARLTKDGRLMKHAKQLIFMTEKLWQKGLFEDQVPIVWNAKFYPDNIKCYTNGNNLAAVVNWDHSVCVSYNPLHKSSINEANTISFLAS